jgi:hypothetical protein
MSAGEHWDPSQYDPDEPTTHAAKWQLGGVGDQDWETKNNQLLHDWLRWDEAIAENVADQCRRHGVKSAPQGWWLRQVTKFRRLLAARYDGQTEPDAKWVDEYRRRLKDRQGEEALALFEAKWSSHR